MTLTGVILASSGQTGTGWPDVTAESSGSGPVCPDRPGMALSASFRTS